MYDDTAIDRRAAALEWLDKNPKLASPYHAALAGHTVTVYDCEEARRKAAGDPTPTPTAWERHLAHPGQRHIEEAHRAAVAPVRRVFGNDDNPHAAA